MQGGHACSLVPPRSRAALPVVVVLLVLPSHCRQREWQGVAVGGRGREVGRERGRRPRRRCHRRRRRRRHLEEREREAAVVVPLCCCCCRCHRDKIISKRKKGKKLWTTLACWPSHSCAANLSQHRHRLAVPSSSGREGGSSCRAWS